MARNVYYAAASLDGFIAEPEEKLEWLTGFEGAGYAGGEDVGDALDGAPAFFESIGALVMGSKTYEFMCAHGEWPYGERPSWVLTHRRLEPMAAAPDLRFAAGEIAELDAEIKATAAGRDVWVVGGGDLASQYIAAGLLDRVQLTVVPVVLGAGLPLFAQPIERPLRLLAVEPFASGMAGLTYEVVR